MKLFIYDHCPFCVKARMVFGLKNKPVTLVTLLNNDEETPIKMIGQKMVPILEKDDGSFMPESMDIVEYVDQLDSKPILLKQSDPWIEQWLRKASEPMMRLCFPRFALTDFEEFATPDARAYFIANKEASRKTTMQALMSESPQLIEQVNLLLVELSEHLFAHPRNYLTVDDIHLFAMLRGLSIVKGLVYPPVVERYRQELAYQSEVPLLDTKAF